jgi:tRNA (cytidine56-2'-O)-methyltransferase
VLAHCRAVEALAAAMADAAERNGLVVERDVVQAGALLHDIGRSVTQGIHHATVGAGLLRADGQWDPRTVLAVERHTGAGIDRAEAKQLGLPDGDYTPRSLEERIVAHADNLHSGDRRLTLAQLETKYQAKGLPHAWLKIRRLHDELCAEVGTDLEALRPAELPEP